MFFMHLMTGEIDPAVEALDKFILECYKQGIRGANKLRGVCRMLREYRAPGDEEEKSNTAGNKAGKLNDLKADGTGSGGNNPNSGSPGGGNTNVKQEPGSGGDVKQEPGSGSAQNSGNTSLTDLPSLITRTTGSSPNAAAAGKGTGGSNSAAGSVPSATTGETGLGSNPNSPRNRGGTTSGSNSSDDLKNRKTGSNSNNCLKGDRDVIFNPQTGGHFSANIPGGNANWIVTNIEKLFRKTAQDFLEEDLLARLQRYPGPLRELVESELKALEKMEQYAIGKLSEKERERKLEDIKVKSEQERRFNAKQDQNRKNLPSWSMFAGNKKENLRQVHAGDDQRHGGNKSHGGHHGGGGHSGHSGSNRGGGHGSHHQHGGHGGSHHHGGSGHRGGHGHSGGHSGHGQGGQNHGGHSHSSHHSSHHSGHQQHSRGGGGGGGHSGGHGGYSGGGYSGGRRNSGGYGGHGSGHSGGHSGGYSGGRRSSGSYGR
jgi:hypothetical protein